MKPTITEYITWINKYINNHDTREINFQNDIVKRMLENIFPYHDIISVDTKGCDSKRHDYYAYSGRYEDSNKQAKPTTPDLLVCKNWDWFNKDNANIEYIATVEVKSPYGSQAIYKKDKKDYPESWKEKIKRHLSAHKIKKVIFTDTLKWDFFENDYEQVCTIELVSRVQKGRGYIYEWRVDAETQFQKLLEKLDDFLQ